MNNTIIISILGLGITGFIFSIILVILDKKLKIDIDPLIEKVTEILPGINCGACGFPGCSNYAKEVVEKKDLFNGCLPGGKEVNDQISSLLGLSTVETLPKKAIILCSGSKDKAKISTVYKGIHTCQAVNLTSGGPDCKYGCIGEGDCEKVCPVKAISIVNGLCVIDHNLCIGCGKCVKTCPRKILKLVDTNQVSCVFVVSCNNPSDMKETKAVCSVGCIGCSLCTKIIKDSPFVINGKLASFDYLKAKSFSEKDADIAKEKCPAKTINKFNV